MPTQNFKVGEMINKRTLNSKTWINFDGSYTTEIHSGHVHFEDENGNLQNVNTDLYDEADLDSFDLPVNKFGKEAFNAAKGLAKAQKKANKLNRDLFDYQGLQVPFEAKLPRNFKRGYTIGKGQDRLSFIPIGASAAKAYIRDNQKNVIDYQDAWNDADVSLELTDRGIKETIILKTDRAPSSFSFEVKGSLADDLTAGELRLMNAWLKDAAGTERDVEQKVRREGDKTFVDLVADVSGLVYPIEIDPTVTISQSSNIGDSYVDSANSTSNFGSNVNLITNDFGTKRMGFFIKFDLSTIPSGSNINSASLYVKAWGNDSVSTASISAQRPLEDWLENSVTWNNKPSFVSHSDPATNYASGSGFISITTKNILQYYMQNGINYGFYINSTNGADTKYFYSKEYSTQSDRPYLSVNYNEPPTVPVVTTPNGGETWNSLHTITWTASTDPDTAQSSLQYQIQLSTDNGATWKDIVALTTAGATSYTYDFINEPETSTALIRIRAYDGTSYGQWDQSDGVFTIQHNQAPSAPTNLSPSAGTPINRAVVQSLSWQHNDADGDQQSKFDLQWRLQGNATWNTVTQATANQYWDAPANTFPRGTIEWQVRTYDQADLSSPYSAIEVFFAGDKPAAPTIISPSEGEIVAVANPTVQWSSSGQTNYQVQVLNASNTVVWDTGDVTSTNKAVTVSADLANGESYTIRVRIKNADGLWSDYVSVSITVSYTPPAVPIVTASTDSAKGAIVLTIDNPTPAGTEPSVSYNSVYRRKQGESEFIRIATNLAPDTPFIDYSPASEQVYEFFVRAWGDNGTYRDSAIVSQSIKLTGVWLHDVTDPESVYNFKLDGGGRSNDWQAQATYMQFAGRVSPVAEFSEHEDDVVSATIKIMKESGEHIILERLLKAKNTLCYRDGRGRRLFGTATQLPLSDQTWGYDTEITIRRTSYSEVV